MTYNTLPLLILEISNGNFTVKTQCETRRIKYIIFDVKKLSNFPDKGDQLFWNWIVSKLFFNNFLFNSVSRKHNGENSNLTFSFPYGVSTSRARARTHTRVLSPVSAQKSCTWPISPLRFPSPSVTVYFSPSLFALLRPTTSFPLLFSLFLRFLISHLALEPSCNFPSFPPPSTHPSPRYKQVVLYGILAHTSTLLIVRKYIYASIMFTESHHWTSFPMGILLRTVVWKSISNTNVCVCINECYSHFWKK